MAGSLKVLVFMTQFYKLNGAEKLAVELAIELNRHGVHTDILSLYSEDLPGAAQAKQALLEKGVPAIHYMGYPIHPPLTSLIPSIFKLRKLIKNEKYNIIETSMLSPTVISAWALHGLPARQIAGLHDEFKKERQNTKNHRFWRFSVRRNRHIRYYAITDYVKQSWVEYSGTQPDHTFTIYNAIPDDCFNAVSDREQLCRELNIPIDAKIALFVGRMLKRKGIDTILEALGPILHSENIHLLYVGGMEQPPEGFFEGETGLWERMTAQIQREGWSERVHYLGRRSDVPRLMASADLLVHPARIEGFGLILAEAMAAGLPIVASRVGGIPEVIADVNYLMTPPDDPAAFREAVKNTLHRSRLETEQVIDAARKRAEYFRIERRINALIQLFSDVLHETR